MTKKLAWTDEEDARLTFVIKSRRVETNVDGTASINASWGEISELMPHRSAKQCRERWCYNLNPAIKRDIWTAEEDAILVKAQSSLGNQWALIARHLPGRTENSVKTRHKSIARARRRAWSEEEDAVILSLHRQIGSRWDKISVRLPGRTPNGVKTRYSLLRKGLAHVSPVPGSPDQILYQPELVEKVKLDVPKHSAKRLKRSRYYFNPVLNGEGKDVKENGNKNTEGTVAIILEELVERVASENGERTVEEPDQPPTKKAKVENKKATKKSNKAPGQSIPNPNVTPLENNTNVHQSKYGDQQQVLGSLLQDPNLSSEVRDALLAQRQQLMMYSNALNSLVMQQRQQQMQQLNLQNQLQLQSQVAPSTLSFLQAAQMRMNPLQQQSFPVSLPGLQGNNFQRNAGTTVNQQLLAQQLQSVIAGQLMR
mmetsp:Transcript_10823/g.13541  ORF Transcript_10823/g.13541 Transcript_10823/m.13541 type:complete len:426 (+) Transcript_10823:172-1449(+)|eukprot:CAMPEP_0204839222 /NCGR_PEP_ID=MMETSP1346-20131115/33474_1 /ASSEMBLY_ACC=CAM_ASM_000771 /TAXON_ID=215587 /ORGANISM="Aplanochytrium stocchinoi, Strain GSBS06" /LENGTH=425 /DNA_ID=CAMNT_0051975799 /DNA_START=369 /DNA_END=1646 /DNA_ORIENTATION=-